MVLKNTQRKVENAVLISFLASAETVNRLDAVTADGVSRSEMLRKLLARGLEQLEREHEQQRMLDLSGRAEQALAKARERKQKP